MAVILKEKKSTYGSPYAYYKVETTDIDNRTADSVDITFKVTSHLANSGSTLGSSYNLTAGIYLASKWYNFKIKDNESWSGTTNHTKTQTITITDLSSSTTSITGIKFRVVSSASDNASGLNATACSNITIPRYHTPPLINGYSITEQNQILINAGINDEVFVTNLSKKAFDINYDLYDDTTFKKASIYNATTYIYQGTSLPIVIDFANNPLRIDALGVPIFVSVTDSLDDRSYFTNVGGSVSSGSSVDYYNYILYNKISITSTTRAKRVGQTSGQVALDIDGACFNGNIGNINQGNSYNETQDTEFLDNKNYYMLDGDYILLQSGTDYNIGDSIESYFTTVYEAQPYKPLLKYKYWKYEDTEPQTYDYTIPANEITISNGIFSVRDYNIGSTIEYILTEDNTFQDGKTYYTLTGTTYSEAIVTVGDTIPSNTYYEVNPMYFDPRYAYRVKVYAEDNFTNTESAELQIQKGIALWSEYEDKVDFNRITKKKGEIYGGKILFEDNSGETGNITLDDDASNYDYLEIYYRYSTSDSYGNYYSKINNPDGNRIALNIMLDNNNYCYQLYCTYSISGTAMTKGTPIQWRFDTSNNNVRATSSNTFAITKVIGYR